MEYLLLNTKFYSINLNTQQRIERNKSLLGVEIAYIWQWLIESAAAGRN